MRSKSDDEILVLGRTARLIEGLEDPCAQARVATYLYMRFTHATEAILPAEEASAVRDLRWRSGEGQLALPLGPTPPGGMPAADAPPARGAPVADPSAPATPSAADAAPGNVATSGEGWDLAGNAAQGGSDDEGEKELQDAANAAKVPGKNRARPVRGTVVQKAVPSPDGGWDLEGALPGDAEVKVKI